IGNAARDLLFETGWKLPDLDALPTAGELTDSYLRPLAELPAIKRGLRLGQRVTNITRLGADKVKTKGRDDMSFLIRVHSESGAAEYRAKAVIDASGTWNQPNPIGGHGIPAIGESDFAHRINFGMPDISGTQRSRYAGKTALVIGAGHSALGNLI